MVTDTLADAVSRAPETAIERLAVLVFTDAVERMAEEESVLVMSEEVE